MDTKENNVVINLDNSLLENSKDEKNIIQQDAYKKCKDLIKQKLELADNYKAKNFDRFHETITVQGKRGTGKTSFILSIKKSIESNSMEVEGIKTLEILDPTLLSDRQKILLTIISNIVDAVKDVNNLTEKQENEWKNKLVNLAEGLNTIINVGTDPIKHNMWDDAGLILEKGLVKSQAGVSFEREFHEFIECSLEIINKKAFLLILDDIDTNFKKGWDVLEIIRKYITTPKLITIISGDISLYNHIIRQEKWKLFEELKKYEDIEKYSTEIDSLQEQYLIKILKPENYINLYSLDYYMNYKNGKYNFSIKSKNFEEKPLEDFINNLFKEMFNSSKVKEYFLSLPIRTNIQLFKAYADVTQGRKKNEEIYLHKKYFFQKIKDIFISSFSNYGIDIQFFEILREDDNINNLLSKFMDNKKLNLFEITESKPQNNDQQKNILILILLGLYNAYIEFNYNKYFEWSIKVILLKVIFNQKSLNLNNTPKYLRLEEKLSTTDRILRILGFTGGEQFSLKTYKYPTYVEKADSETTFSLIQDQKTISEEEILINLFYFGLNKKEIEFTDYVSFLFIFPFLEEILKYKDLSNDEIINSLSNFYVNILNNRKILIESNEDLKNIAGDDTDDNDDEKEDDTEINISEDFINNIKTWLEKINVSKSKFNLNDINSSMNRFFKLHYEIKEYKKEISTYAEYIEFNAFTFLNELLIASYARNNGTPITFKAVTRYQSARKNFITNLNKYKTNLEEAINDFTDFFVIILNCPIWFYYISDYNEILDSNEYIFNPLKEKLENIPLHGSKMKKELFKETVQRIMNKNTELSLEEIQNDINNLAKNIGTKKYKRPLPNKKMKDEVFEELKTKNDEKQIINEH